MNLMNGDFDAYLSKIGSKYKDEDVVTEFQITHVSDNIHEQNFLAAYAMKHNKPVNDCFINPVWDNIKFSLGVPNLEITFDAMTVKADLVSIKVTRKETKTGITTKYDMLFNKKQTADDVHLATYLNHKTENDDGKKELDYYVTEVESISQM